MITLHGEEVKVGDKVWHLLQGWGEVTELNNRRPCPIFVQWEGVCGWFTKDGEFLDDVKPTLFWQPVEFEIPKKPKPKEKAWQWVCKTRGKYWLTPCHYVSKEDVSKRNSITEPIEPYLPSEIEREKVN